MRRVISGTLVAFLAIAGGGACQSDGGAQDQSTRSETGTIVDEGDIGVFALKLGDCVGNLPSEVETVVASLEGVPCEQPHDAQVYAAYDVTFGEFPGDTAMDDAAFEGCMDRIPASIEDEWGVDGTYGPYILQPTSETWELGDREVMCMVVRVDGATMTGDLL